MELTKETRSRGKFLNAALIVLYAGITLFMTFHHEPWRDEAQSWLIVRDLDLPGIFKQMNYEGTPALWHMLIYPFVRLAFPFFAQQLLNWALAASFVALFVIFSPFPFIMRAAFAFSMFTGYEYPVISRNYSLHILLLFGVAALYQKRFQKPLLFGSLIFLLFNTSVLSLAWASSILTVFAYELLKKRNELSRETLKKGYLAVLISVLGVFLGLLQLIPNPDNAYKGNMLIISSPQEIFTVTLPNILSTALFPGFPQSALIISASFLILLTVLVSLRHWKYLMFIVLPLTWFLYVFSFRTDGSPRHYGLILASLVFALWIAFGDEKASIERVLFRKAAVYGLTITLLISVYWTVDLYKTEYDLAFSTAKRTAEFIRANHLEDKTFVAHRSPFASSILPHLPGKKKFWYADIEDYGSFVTWNQKYMKNTFIEDKKVVERMYARFPDRKDLLLLLSHPLAPEESAGFELIYSSAGEFEPFFQEFYFIYRPLF